MLRPLVASLVVFLVVTGCAAGSAPPPPEPPSRDPRAAISQVLDAFHAAAAEADEARYFDHLDEDSIFLGTDATERWEKAAFRAYAHPHFEKGKAWSFRATRRNVEVQGDVAWFDEDLATPNLGPARGSGVLVKRPEGWKIAQYNLAITVPNERFDLVAEAAGAATVRSAREGDPLADLAWLAGAWLATTPNGERVEELWTSADGGTLIGSGRTVKGDETVFFEHLRIEAREGAVVYVAQPLGGAPTEFVRQASSNGEAIFVNLGHDWPKRVAYQRTADGLVVRVSGAPDQRTETFTLRPALIERRTLE